MHLPLIKALAVATSAAGWRNRRRIGPCPKRRPARPGSGRAAGQRTTLEADGLELLGQLAAGKVKPDPALKQSWPDDVSAAAQTLGLSDRELAAQLSDGRSLAQITALRAVPTSIPATALRRRIRADRDRAEHDRAISPIAARAVLDALTTALGNS